MSVEGITLRYRIEPGGSRLTVKVTASGPLSAMGHNPTIAVGEYSGEATVLRDNLESATLRVALSTK